MEQYRLLAECLLPARMLAWFDLKPVRVEKKGDTQVIHLYLDENEQKPDDGEDLRPYGFTRESVFHDFPIRGQEVLLHVVAPYVGAWIETWLSVETEICY